MKRGLLAVSVCLALTATLSACDSDQVAVSYRSPATTVEAGVGTALSALRVEAGAARVDIGPRIQGPIEVDRLLVWLGEEDSDGVWRPREYEESVTCEPSSKLQCGLVDADVRVDFMDVERVSDDRLSVSVTISIPLDHVARRGFSTERVHVEVSKVDGKWVVRDLDRRGDAHG